MKHETKLLKMLMSAYKVEKEPTGVLCGCDPIRIVGLNSQFPDVKIYTVETAFGIIKIKRDSRLNDKEFVLIYD